MSKKEVWFWNLEVAESIMEKIGKQQDQRKPMSENGCVAVAKKLLGIISEAGNSSEWQSLDGDKFRCLRWI